MLLLVFLRILVVVVRFVLHPWFREVRMVDVGFSRPAMWLTTVTFSLAACGVGAPSLPIQVPVPSTAAEAPTGFDNRSNGTVDDSTHQADQDAFDERSEERRVGKECRSRWSP